MKITVIGAGATGGNLALLLSQAGHEVLVTDAPGVNAATGDILTAGPRAADLEGHVIDRDVVILSIPFAKQPEVAGLLATAPAGTIVVDTANYYASSNGAIEVIEEGQVESEWSQQQLGRLIVKAWNAALAGAQHNEGRPPASPDGRLAVPVASDSAAARRIVMQLVDDTGFDPVDAGVLADSWRLQPGTSAYCTKLSTEDLRHALAATDEAKAPVTRDRLVKDFATLTPWRPLAQVVAINRSRPELPSQADPSAEQ